MTNQLYYGIKSISERLGLSCPKVRQWIRDGRISARRDGKGECAPWFITERLLLADLERLEEE